MIPADVGSPPPVTVVVRVPEVATTAADGLDHLLAAGRLRLVLPVWEASNGAAARAWLEVGRTACSPVDLHPGAVVRVSCSAHVRSGTQLTVRVVTDQGVVAAWSHAVR